MRWTLLVALIAALIGCGDSTRETEMPVHDSRSRLLARIGEVNDFERPRPLVTLEEFFEGNRDFASIGYNFYPDQPSPADFFELFRGIRSKPTVAAVLVQVQDLEDPEGWPSTDTIWVITSSTSADITSWFGERFRPDEILVGFPDSGVEPFDVPAGHQAFGVWYD